MTDEAVVEEKEYKYLLCSAEYYPKDASLDRVLRRWDGESHSKLELWANWRDKPEWAPDCFCYYSLCEANQREVSKEQAEAFMRGEEVD